MVQEAGKFELIIDPPISGCVHIRVAFLGEEHTFCASYIGDVFVGLVGTVADIAESRAQSTGIVRFDWQDEPGSWRWELEPGGDQITVRVIELAKNFAGRHDTGKLLFEWHVPARRFCNCVLRAMDRLACIPPEDFEREWRGSLPGTKIARLRLAMSRWR